MGITCGVDTNDLSGSIPSEYGQLSELRTLDLGEFKAMTTIHGNIWCECCFLHF